MQWVGFGRRAQTIRFDTSETPWGATVAVDPKFASMVERLQAEAQRDPDVYRRKVMAAGALGIGFVVAVLGGLAAICAGIVLLMIESDRANAFAVKFLIVLGLVAFGIARSLWVRIPPPDGRAIERDEAPQLFALIDEVRSRLAGPGIDTVLITTDFNAAIVQHPRLGLVGGYANYLILGLPLLHGLTRSEVAAVIAHEYGHLAGSHGRSAAWIYRMRQIWAQLSVNLAGGHTANLMRRFFNWYGPWFNAYSFVLARSNEYDADRAAADVTSPRTAADALLRVSLQGARFGYEHWGAIIAQVDKAPRPATMPYASARRFFVEPVADAEDRLKRAMAQSTDLSDTHPCLADRLAALGEEVRVPQPIERTAADELLGAKADQISAEFDRDWWSAAGDSWTARHAESEAARQELETLDAKAAEGALDPESAWRRAALTEAVCGSAEALPLFEAIAEANPDNHVAAFAVGRIRLAYDDGSGIALIEKAMAGDPDFAEAGCCEILDFLYRAGRDADTGPYHQQLDAARARMLEAEAERNELPPDVELEPARIEPQAAEGLRAILAGMKEVKSVHVALRRLSRDPTPQHVLVITTSIAIDQEALGRIIDCFQPHGHVLAVTVSDETRWLYSRMKKIPGSLIFGR